MQIDINEYKNADRPFEKYLEDKFMSLREIAGVPITKENCEDMFSAWLEDVEQYELIEYANSFARLLLDSIK